MLRVSSVALLCIAVATSCAHDVNIQFPGQTEPSAGSVEILFSRVARDVTIALDGRLVANRAHTGRVLVRGVPVGYSEVSIAAGSGPARVERMVRVSVDHGETTTIPVAAPESSAFADVPTSLVTILSVIAARFLYVAIF